MWKMDPNVGIQGLARGRIIKKIRIKLGQAKIGGGT